MGKLSYANVMATVAVFIAIGGGAYAAGLAKNSVGSKQIKNGQVKVEDLGENSVSGSKVKDGSLLPADFNSPDSLKGPKGDQGDPGEPATKLFAAVRSNGDLSYGSGVDSVSRDEAGKYSVEFNQSVVGCVAIASAGVGDNFALGDLYVSGSTASVKMFESPSTGRVDVFTDDGGGGIADRSFLVAVLC